MPATPPVYTPTSDAHDLIEQCRRALQSGITLEQLQKNYRDVIDVQLNCCDKAAHEIARQEKNRETSMHIIKIAREVLDALPHLDVA